MLGPLGHEHVVDELVLAAVERLGDARDGRQPAQLLARRLAQHVVLAVALARLLLAVIARHVGDEIDLVGIEAPDVAVADDVRRVHGVLVVADDVADVVEERGVLEQAPRLLAQAVAVGQPVEERERQLGHVARVRPVLAELGEQAQHAAALQVVDADELLDLLAVAGHVVGDQPLAHARVGERDAVGTHRLEHVHEHEAPGSTISARCVSRPRSRSRSENGMRSSSLVSLASDESARKWPLICSISDPISR